MTGNKQARRAVSRCYGAMFFAVFGGVWMVFANLALARMSARAAVLIAIAVVCLLWPAFRIQRRAKPAAENAYPAAEKQRNDRAFGLVNAVTWSVAFLMFLIFPRIGWRDLTFTALAIIVGLHFFPMPPLYRHRANVVTGVCMIVWAVAVTMLFQGDERTGLICLGSGLILWMSAVWALLAARRLLQTV